jgi:putative membrane protein
VQFLVKVLVNAVAIWVAAAVVPGVEVTGNGTGRTVITLLLLGLLFGIVNAVIKPIVRFFSLPFYFLTLGLFAFIVNALMLEIVAWLSDPERLDISFRIDDFFWSAVLAAVVVTVVSWILNLVLPDGD